MWRLFLCEVLNHILGCNRRAQRERSLQVRKAGRRRCDRRVPVC
eukprot:COSAG01_NODE_35380_length_532_cov_8.958430_2_plen_43_part_01